MNDDDVIRLDDGTTLEPVEQQGQEEHSDGGDTGTAVSGDSAGSATDAELLAAVRSIESKLDGIHDAMAGSADDAQTETTVYTCTLDAQTMAQINGNSDTMAGLTRMNNAIGIIGLCLVSAVFGALLFMLVTKGWRR